jgi:hypothetical protein
MHAALEVTAQSFRSFHSMFEVGISWPFAAKVTSTINSSDVKENRTVVLLRPLDETRNQLV